MVVTMIFVFVLQLVFRIVLGVKVTDCPPNSIKFEKTIGIRPSDNNNALLLYKNDRNVTVTAECTSRCASNVDCLAFVLFYNASECFWYREPIDRFRENETVTDSDSAWFSKKCLYAKNCQNLWVFDRVPGAILIGNNRKPLRKQTTREECQQYCLNETDFQCRSAKFKITESKSGNTMGICILSDTDRHLVPSSYRVSSYDEEYFENQCLTKTTNEFCAFEEYENALLRHVDNSYENKTKNECQSLCDSNSNFHCRGFSLLPVVFPQNTHALPVYHCLIHSEDSKVHGPKLLKDHNGAKYFERAPCLNVSVDCTETYMTIKYKPENDFNGKIYMRGYSENLECFALGKGGDVVTLKIPLLAPQCGISQANSELNRTLLSTTMILQYNRLIQTQADRIIKVGCIFGDDTKILIGTGVNFTQSPPNVGTTKIDTNTNLPEVQMKIVDLNSQNEVVDTQIGEELQLIIEMTQSKNRNPYDIWAGHLVAMTENGQDSILLLDDRGCPTNLNVFPALTKKHTNTTVTLLATFQAFKFSSSSIIRFSVIVQFCSVQCPSTQCASTVRYNTRGKRAKQPSILQTGNSTIVVVDKNEFYAKGKNAIDEMPLEFIIIVRNSKTTSDRLIYGENNKILVAGYNYVSNEVCFDYSLLVALVITWVLIQIIFLVCCFFLIRKYKKYYQEEYLQQSLEDLHKNFGLGFSNLENRRVRFADGIDLT